MYKSLLKSQVHLNDNSKVNDDTKYGKGFNVKPLIQAVNNKFFQFVVFEEQTAVDEMIIIYFG